MNQPNRTLTDIITQLPVQADELGTTRFYQTYLSMFGINVAHRFPDVRVDQIDVDELRHVAEFSTVCTLVAVDVWDRILTDQTTRRDRGLASRQRVA